MIDIKDLMVGNYVKVNFGLGEGDIFKVERICNNNCEGLIDLINDSLSEEYAIGHFTEQLDPIELTDDILSKNFGHTIVLDNYPFEYTEWFTNGFKLQKLNDNMYYWIAQGSDTGIIQVKYVHQLQQILNLLNIDIDFKL